MEPDPAVERHADLRVGSDVGRRRGGAVHACGRGWGRHEAREGPAPRLRRRGGQAVPPPAAPAAAAAVRFPLQLHW